MGNSLEVCCLKDDKAEIRDPSRKSEFGPKPIRATIRGKKRESTSEIRVSKEQLKN